MFSSWQVWLKGLLAALIGGASNGVVTSFTLAGVDSQHFNFSGGLHNLLVTSGSVAATSAILSAAMYLKQSPIPPNGAK